jgi:hypothetical protein
MKSFAQIVICFAISSCASVAPPAASTWPIFDLNGAVNTSEWIAIGRIEQLRSNPCSYGSYGGVSDAAFVVEEPLKGGRIGERIPIKVFASPDSFAEGARYFVFFRPVDGPCGHVSTNPGFLSISAGNVLTRGVVSEPESQALALFTSRVRSTLSAR